MRSENKSDELIHKDIMSKLFELMPKIEGMELPPKVFIDMQGQFIEFVDGESLSVLFPNQKRST